MSKAFQCDRCGELIQGSPEEIRLSVEEPNEPSNLGVDASIHGISLIFYRSLLIDGREYGIAMVDKVIRPGEEADYCKKCQKAILTKIFKNYLKKENVRT